MHRSCCYLLFLLILTISIELNAYLIQQPKLEVNENDFRLSIEDDPDIKWVEFHVNINKPFRQYENGQYQCSANMPMQRRWSCEFEIPLKDEDVIYSWIKVQHNIIPYRSKKNPFSVGAFRRGERNYILITTTTRTPVLPNNAIGGSGVGDSHECKSAVTIIENSTHTDKICRDQLIFEDKFDVFNNTIWTNEVRIPTSQYDYEFVLYNGTAVVDNGKLKITASAPGLDITKSIDLGERCTGKNIDECSYRFRLFYFLPPVISGRINSAKSFNFKYGRVEVKAKLPKGDWLFPLISLQPSHNEYGSKPYENGEMRIAFIRGNENLLWNNENIDGKRLYGGAIFSSWAPDRHQFMVNTTLDEHFGNSFHVYSLTWKPDELILSVDGNEYGTIRTDFKNHLNIPAWQNKAKNVPLDQMFYITLGLAAGGHGDFPQNIENKPWENTDPKATWRFNENLDKWKPTWSQPILEIDYVRVFAV